MITAICDAAYALGMAVRIDVWIKPDPLHYPDKRWGFRSLSQAATFLALCRQATETTCPETEDILVCAAAECIDMVEG